MERYIDSDALIKKMFPLGMGSGMYVINAKAVKFAIDNTPTADVVPKSEVERLESEVAILNEKNAGLALACFCDCMANEDCLGHNEWKAIKAEVAQEIFAEIEKHDCKPIPEVETIYVLTKRQFAELKKKYVKEGED